MKFNTQLITSICLYGLITSQNIHFTKNDPLSDIKPMKILVSMTFGSRSHIKNVLEIGKVLKERGHSIGYMALKPMLRFADGYNVTKFQVGPSDIHIDDHRGISDINTIPVNPLSDTIEALVENVPFIHDITFEDTLRVIDEYKPDAMICDFFSVSCTDAAYHRKIPLMVGFQTLDGPYVPPPYITSTLTYFPTTIDNLNFGERIYSTLIHPLTILPNFLKLNDKVNRVRTKYNLPHTFGINVGNWGNSLKLCNTFIGFEAARPLDPSFKLIGPVMSDEFTPLDKKLESFLNKREKILYIAFGSGVQLSAKDVDIIFGSVKLLLENKQADGVVWALGKTSPTKFNSTNIQLTYNSKVYNSNSLLANQHPNFKILNWAPQVAILSHSSVKLFLSHGGLESAFESMHSGTPIIAMPFFGDQYRNARKVEELGFGGYTDRFTHNSLSLYNKLSTMLQDKDGKINNSMTKWQIIARMNAKRKYEAADIIEGYVLTARICRSRPGYIPSVPGCELEYLLPGYQKLNPFFAFGLDVFLAAFVAVVITLYPFFYLIRYTIKKLWHLSHAKGQNKLKVH